MSKILVFGGAGFIGHNAMRFLERFNHKALAYDSFTNYGFVPEKEMAYLKEHRMKRYTSETVEGDIRNAALVDYVMSKFKPDIVIHLASFPRQKVVGEQPIWGSDVMMTGLITLLEASKKHNIKKFVYASSSMVYGDFTSESQTEDLPTAPIGQYGIMKLAGEWLVKDYARRTNMKYTIIRPSAVYGEWDVEDRVVSKFMTMAMRGETLNVKGVDEVLDFTYVDDTAMGFVLAATTDAADNQIYNITRSEKRVYTLLDAAKLAIEITGKGDLKAAEKDPAFPSRGKLSIKKAMLDLDYQPTVNVEEGFRRYHQWYLKNPALWQK